LHFVADQEYRIVRKVLNLAIFQLYRVVYIVSGKIGRYAEPGLYRPRVKFFVIFEVVQHYLYSKHATKMMSKLLEKTKIRG
jgi:hypothetical protein